MENTAEKTTEYTGEKTSPIMIAVAWVVVAIPLLYGIYFTVEKAKALFQ